MKFAIRIGYKDVLLTAEQLEGLLNLVSDSEVLDERAEKGEDGKYHTLYTLGGKFSVNDGARLRVVTAEEYESLRFITHAQKTA